MSMETMGNCPTVMQEIYGPTIETLYAKRNRSEAMTLKNVIAIEGPDGCGKSSIALGVCKKLREVGIPAFVVREPGATIVGENLRSMLLDRHVPISRATEFILFAAARASLIDVLRTNPDRIFILDRYTESTVIYQYLVPAILAPIQKIDDSSQFTFIDNRCIYQIIETEMNTGGWWPLPLVTYLIGRDRDKSWEAANQEKNYYEEKGRKYYNLVCTGYDLIRDFICPDAVPVDSVKYPYIYINNDKPLEETIDQIFISAKTHLLELYSEWYIKSRMNQDLFFPPEGLLVRTS